MNDTRRESAVTLEILEEIERTSDVTQRQLARKSGVALGLANAYLKRCVRKGLVKIKQAPANRYLYYLTPKGFAEKSRLTAEYLSYSFTFYRRASESCAVALAECRQLGHSVVGLYGASDLAEVAAIRALEQGMRVGCLCDPSGSRARFLDVPVVRAVDEAPEVPVWLLTSLDNPRAAWRRLREQAGAERVMVPSILGFEQGDRDN